MKIERLSAGTAYAIQEKLSPGKENSVDLEDFILELVNREIEYHDLVERSEVDSTSTLQSILASAGDAIDEWECAVGQISGAIDELKSLIVRTKITRG